MTFAQAHPSFDKQSVIIISTRVMSDRKMFPEDKEKVLQLTHKWITTKFPSPDELWEVGQKFPDRALFESTLRSLPTPTLQHYLAAQNQSLAYSIKTTLQQQLKEREIQDQESGQNLIEFTLPCPDLQQCVQLLLHDAFILHYTTTALVFLVCLYPSALIDHIFNLPHIQTLVLVVTIRMEHQKYIQGGIKKYLMDEFMRKSQHTLMMLRRSDFLHPASRKNKHKRSSIAKEATNLTMKSRMKRTCQDLTCPKNIPHLMLVFVSVFIVFAPEGHSWLVLCIEWEIILVVTVIVFTLYSMMFLKSEIDYYQLSTSASQ